MSDTIQKSENKQDPRSKGERLFDWLTYGGWAGVGTFITTIPIAYWAKYGGGAKGFAKAAEGLRKMGLGKQTVLMTTVLMQGGNLMLLPVKLMEDHKPKIVEKLNQWMGEKDEIEQVKEEPKQTWSSIIKARLVAWVMVFSSFKGASMLIGPEKFEHFEDMFAKHVVCKPLGKPTHINGMETKTFRYGKIAALDVFATVASATLLYIGSRFFAGFKKNKQPAQNADDAPAKQDVIMPAPTRNFADALAPREKPAQNASHAEAIQRQAASAALSL